MVIPAIILFLPAYYLIQSVWAKFHRQYLNNICLIIISSHGMTTTIVMLLIHAPYREFLFGNSRFRINFGNERTNSVQVVQTIAVTRTRI
ncbi:hypothetical protein CAEBREN_28723 [Caenorhabditis brenneri]|uniref:Serpentine receptor class gamma n=1 Tax=Caenorhabditis brenneri TaxID=135651 RepID=G0NHX4_CAEBE|nr:hypothetical protein CAEBREN_28723 [Caenorhabditis brenneri]